MKKTIAIVDDSASCRAILVNMISLNQPNWLVYEFDSGQQLLNATKKIKFDIFSIDLIMPDMDGIELIKKLYKLNPTSEIVMVTGDESQRTAIVIEALHVKLIHKPLTNSTIDEWYCYVSK